MKAIFKNVDLIMRRTRIETFPFNVPYANIVEYGLNSNVNLIYSGELHVGDIVNITFDNANPLKGNMAIYTKSGTGYGDGKGMGTMRLTPGSRTIGPITVTGECINIKYYTNNKANLTGTIWETNGMTGTVTIMRA